MFSRIAFLLALRYPSSSPFLTPPISFLNTMSACFPIAFLISATIGVTLAFLPITASILFFKTLTVDITFSFTCFNPSTPNTFCWIRFLYLAFSSTISSKVVSLAVTPLASDTSSSKAESVTLPVFKAPAILLPKKAIK